MREAMHGQCGCLTTPTGRGNPQGEHHMHRYTLDGSKEEPETFHHGTPGAAMRDAIAMVRSGFERMIEQWR